MIKIEIASNLVETKSGVSAKSSKPYSIRQQEGWALTYNSQTSQPNPHPQKIVFTLDDNQPPYPVGLYMLDPSSLYVGKFDSLMIGRVKLIARPAAAAKVSAAA